MVHASKFGPLYRMEKWCSPYLTTISRTFCAEEFILDTGHLIKNMESTNEEGSMENGNINLFTLDVEKLYPSIQPEVAIQAIQETLSADKTTDKKTKKAIEQFIKLSFEHSYVTYQNECFKSEIGIPTGGSLSRQIADIFLHWILFVKMRPKINSIQFIKFWNRFIDDCLGAWRGTKRSFNNFVTQLNSETTQYGIKFPANEVQFGKSVHFLDLCVYLEEDNSIQYRGYTKPTDAKRYLNPKSFHPAAVFNSIPFSQLLRVWRNNSKDETRNAELVQCIKQFENSGYNPDRLNELNNKVRTKVTTPTEENENPEESEETETLVFPMHYFHGVTEFKKLVRSLNVEFNQLIGDTRIMFAMKKGSSLGNLVVRNKQLSITQTEGESQRCNGRGCLQCPLTNMKSKVVVNGIVVHIPRHLNCRSRNVIYMWICKLCGERDVYFGRTIQKCQVRTSGHRNCFNGDEGKWEKSALSMHAWDMHQSQFSLENFTISVVKKVSPQQLRREEYKFIEKYRTIPLGLNLYKV